MTTAISAKELPHLVSKSSSRNLVFMETSMDAGVVARQVAISSLLKVYEPLALEPFAAQADYETEVIPLTADQDGIAQISQVLADRQNLKTMQLLVQGQPGCLTLGTAQLCLETLDRYADQLRTWSSAFAGDGELVISGYKVAKATEGRTFVQRLHQLTGMTVTASIVLTGSAVLGGEWELKMQVGREAVALAERSPLQAA